MTAETYWHCYHEAETLARILAAATGRRIPSTGVSLHLDLYRQPAAGAPIVVLNHGGGGHAGLLAGLALTLFERGMTVVVPDQKGQGRSGGARSDFTLAEAVENIVDAAIFARSLGQWAAGPGRGQHRRRPDLLCSGRTGPARPGAGRRHLPEPVRFRPARHRTRPHLAWPPWPGFRGWPPGCGPWSQFCRRAFACRTARWRALPI